jgi:hypothetical protein
MRLHRLPLLAVSLAVLCQPLLAPRPALAVEWFSWTPTVHVAFHEGESQSQLAERLRALGYGDIVLSSVYASPANPHPEIYPWATAHPEQTPVHDGWNGIAVKDGQMVQVYADR